MNENINKQFQELLKKAEKYDNRQRVDEEINEKIAKIDVLLDEIKKLTLYNLPTTREYSDRNVNKQRANEIYQKMIEGTYVNVDLIMKTYDVSTQDAYNLINKIRRDHTGHVETTKIDGKTCIYAKQTR